MVWISFKINSKRYQEDRSWFRSEVFTVNFKYSQQNI